MSATPTMTNLRRRSSIGTAYVMSVGGEACSVRTATIWPIHEVLGIEDELDSLAVEAGGDVTADLLDSRMIAPPRPRRRRERALSSRAVFYAGGDG